MFDFFKNDDVCNASTNEKELTLFADWLQSDIQDSEVVADIYLDKINRVISGELNEIDQTGNMFTLTICNSGAQILYDDEFSDVKHMESAIMPLDELIILLNNWKKFIRH